MGVMDNLVKDYIAFCDRRQKYFDEKTELWKTEGSMVAQMAERVKQDLKVQSKFWRSGVPIQDSLSRRIPKLWYLSQIVGEANM